MISFIVLLLFIGSPKASRILLLGEKAEKQLVALFEEAQSSTFKVSTIYIDHDQEDEAEQNSTFCSQLSTAGSFAARSRGQSDQCRSERTSTGHTLLRSI